MCLCPTFERSAPACAFVNTPVSSASVSRTYDGRRYTIELAITMKEVCVTTEDNTTTEQKGIVL